MTLEEEKSACIERAEALLEKVKSEGREMTEEEKQQYDADVQRAEDIAKEIGEQEARAKKLEAIRSKVVNPLQTRGTFDGKAEMKDLSKFSLGRAIRMLASRSTIDGVEKEVFDEGQKEARDARVGFDTRAMVIPASAIKAMSKRATTTGNAGGLVPTDVYGNIFEAYQNRQILSKLGATIFDNLSGDVTINTQTGVGGTIGVVGEVAGAVSVDPAINAVKLSPSRISAYTQLSNKLLTQSSPDVEAFAMDNLVKAIMSAFQGAVFTGTGEIKGIPSVTGVNSVVMGKAGEPSWSEILGLIGTLAGVDFDLNRSGFALNSTMMTKLMSTLKSANNFEFIMSEGFNADGTKTLAGLKAGISNSVGDNLVFGAWENLFVGMWGGVGLIYDPYTQAKNGSVEVTAEIFADAKIGNPALFSVLSNS